MSKEDSDDEYYTEMLSIKKSRQMRKGSHFEYNKRLRQIRRDMSAISDADFVVAWQRCSTLVQLSNVLNVSVKGAIDRAATLRENGVPLKAL